MTDGRCLENYYDVIALPRIRMKFGRPTQNHIPMTKTSKWEAEIEFQHGGRLFSETGSSISSVD